MPGLILKLKAHEQILVNGVVMQNGERNARLIVKTPDARILRLRDAIHPADANTPLRRACYVAQLAVAGEADDSAVYRDLDQRLAELRRAIGPLDRDGHLTSAREELDKLNFYGVLRSLRNILDMENKLLTAPPPDPGRLSLMGAG